MKGKNKRFRNNNRRFISRPLKTDMLYDEFFDMIVNLGEELNFYYNDIEYWISHDGEMSFLTDATNKVSQEFKTPEQLFENGRIEEKRIKDIWNDVKM